MIRERQTAGGTRSATVFAASLVDALRELTEFVEREEPGSFVNIVGSPDATSYRLVAVFPRSERDLASSGAPA